ncbi:hypothetical protein JTB14_011788 [Gonioctena quinquepunctata]|nr:hypothetical protein JTB14_011788 [Gonioctena quinquepunctata]
MSDERKSLLSKYITIFFVFGYWVVSMSTMFVNKTLLKVLDNYLDAPMFTSFSIGVLSIAFSQGLIAALFYYLKKILSRKFPYSFPVVVVWVGYKARRQRKELRKEKTFQAKEAECKEAETFSAEQYV